MTIATRHLPRPMISVAALTLAVGTATTLAAAPWKELGPAPVVSGDYTGRVSAIVCSSTDPDLYYAAGADGGIWKTTNGGQSWIPLTDQMPTSAMGALAIDPNDDNVVYAGTGEANYANHSRYGLGVFRTTDGGQTWTHLAASDFAGRCFSKLVVNPLSTDNLYAAITPAGGFPARAAARGHSQADGPVGVFKSTDAGVTWTQLTNGLPAIDATDLAIDPVNPSVLYAAIGDIFGDPENGVYKTTDGGASWTKLGGGLPTHSFGRVSVAVSPSDPDVVYAIIVAKADESGDGAVTHNVFRSDDAGTTWTPLNSGNFQATYGWYLSVVSVAPTDPMIAFVGGLSLLRANNGGQSFSSVTPPHVDQHALAWDAAGRLVVGDDGGVHRTSDLGNNWDSLNSNLGCIQFYPGLSLSTADPNYLYGGTQDNGTNYRTADDAGWTSILGGDGGCTGVRRDHPQYVFCEYQGTGNLFRSSNYGIGTGASASGINTNDRNCFLPPYAISPLEDHKMLYATHRVYMSLDGGSNWNVRSGDLTNGEGAIRCLVMAPSNPNVVYVVTNDGNVQVSQDFAQSFTLVRTGVPGWPRTTRQVAVDPLVPARAVLCVGYFGVDHVLLTENFGATWTIIDGDLPDIPVNAVAIESRPNENIIYIGTDVGVYRTLNGAVNWRKLGTSLPNVPVTDLIVDVERERLVVGTQGRGAWQMSISHDGDSDGDNDVDLADYLAFQQCLGGPVAPVALRGVLRDDCLSAFDFDNDMDVDLDDFARFQVNFIGSVFPDCNNNSIPDVCDVNCGEPGGACSVSGCGQSKDCNTNSIPDECEIDCNNNGIPDDCDIAADHNCCVPGLGAGCTEPDVEACVCSFDPYCCATAWDRICASEVISMNCGGCPSNDCNANAIPDECDTDCNSDGFADECAIAAQPADVAACPNGQAQFTAQASDPAFAYQWNEDGVPLSDGPNVSGTTSDTLTLSSLVPADDGRAFTCEILDGCVLAESVPASLQLRTLGTISQQPQTTLSTCVGQNASFSINVSGADPAPTYRWHRNGQPLTNDAKHNGVFTKVISITGVSHDDQDAQYTCLVSNVCDSISSQPGTIRVVTPDFTLQPQDTCGEIGETIVLTVQATAPQTIFYQWRKGTTTVGAGTTLTIDNLEPADAGDYYVQAFTISPTCTAISETATVTVGDCGTE